MRPTTAAAETTWETMQPMVQSSKRFAGGDLSEPFAASDFEAACPGSGAGTYVAFLAKQAVGNPGGETELFERVDRGVYRLVRPLKYGL